MPAELNTANAIEKLKAHYLTKKEPVLRMCHMQMLERRDSHEDDTPQHALYGAHADAIAQAFSEKFPEAAPLV